MVQALDLPFDRIIAFGRSMGSLYAIELAARQPTLAALIIESGIADPAERFLNYADLDAAGVMGYRIDEIEWVRAMTITGNHKADVQVQVTIKLTGVLGIENVQVKLVSQRTGFNQIDKRWVKAYAELWEMPEEIVTLFRRFTGEIPPTVPARDPRRMFADEFTAEERSQLVQFLHNNQTLIVSDILKGRGKFSAEWFLVILRTQSTEAWALKPINYVLNFFGNGEIEVTSRGSFRIGRITLQRKGGDGGRNTANMLQFKINPALLIVPETHES